MVPASGGESVLEVPQPPPSPEADLAASNAPAKKPKPYVPVSPTVASAAPGNMASERGFDLLPLLAATAGVLAAGAILWRLFRGTRGSKA